MIEEPWFPADRCDHRAWEIYFKIVIGEHWSEEAQFPWYGRCQACYDEFPWPRTWHPFRIRADGVEGR